jgi:sigma-B regulation protein RsbU (phosphoserine phosphatase)
LRKGQAPEFIGKGGLPIGLINDASQHQLECSLNAGDRLLIYSDGFVEAEMPDGSLLDDRGLLGLIAETHGSGPAYLDVLYDNLLKIVGDVRDDDISAVLLEVL